ncbi:MAG TPA: PEP-CTERM sorting domain-containing protein [Lacipirellulaceae bacterium]|nr:PEP-CTERM sorting domain-containing protein [Lacipirellulaceae bacterium]
MKRHLGIGLALLAALGFGAAAPSRAAVLMSDSFSRTPASTPVGSPPTLDTTQLPNHISDWGANNNALGGTLVQTYTTYLDTNGNQGRLDAGRLSGNWLNNGTPLTANSGPSPITEPIGIPGFAWVQIDHDFAADATVLSAGKLRINFDLYRPPGGNLAWFFGQSDPTGVANGADGSAVLRTSNDVAILFRGLQSATLGLFDNGVNPSIPGIANTNQFGFAGGTTITYPLAIQIDVTGSSYAGGATSQLELWVNGTQQDLNGSAAGAAYTFTWDNEGVAYMGFSSNNSPISAGGALLASGIDNLVIRAVPEPASLGLIASAVGALAAVRRRCGVLRRA